MEARVARYAVPQLCCMVGTQIRYSMEMKSMSKLSIAEFRDCIQKHSLFYLSSGCPWFPLKVEGWFDRAVVAIGPYPVLHLKCGDDVGVNLRHIKEVQQHTTDKATEYRLTCFDYSGEKPDCVVFNLICM